MPAKSAIMLTVESRHSGETYVQKVEGTLYRKENAVYLRYAETDEAMGNTMTTVRIDPQELKIIRHGEVESDQTFAVGRRLPGNYRTPFVSMQLETHTQLIHADVTGATGTLQWNYDLYFDGDFSGDYKIKMSYQEVQSE
ncbi:DUF1934 domain-containing protein [Paenibacillus gansuensis]|uniref:DUF1934 domain-containing protein n=1 Tax=Paenibacillus gansuensis TaxID=306542 RepID=A0ABW5PHN8_9BACL